VSVVSKKKKVKLEKKGITSLDNHDQKSKAKPSGTLFFKAKREREEVKKCHYASPHFFLLH
jgi:hypothetical protein